MIKKMTIITAIAGTVLLASNSFASAPATTKNNTDTNSEGQLQKIIGDFNSYASGVSAEVREEIRKYRISIAEVNKKKRELYKGLTQEAQNYLAEEQKYKKRLALSKKNPDDNKTTIKPSDDKTSKVDDKSK